MKDTYLVSGYMRTGTSMMMQCLAAGGLDPVVDPRREEMNKHYGDRYYQPNRFGFFEPAYVKFREEGFPREYEGRLLKILFRGLRNLVDMPYKVAFMRRDPEEIRQSWEGFTSKPADLKVIYNYDWLMDEAVDFARGRGDDVVEFWYPDVVSRPHMAFRRLEKRGWPIDVKAAAACVDPEQYRFRRELLELGI